MSVESSAATGMKLSSQITDVLLSELAKTLRLRQLADKKILERIEATEASRDKYASYASMIEKRMQDTEKVLEEIKKMKDLSPEDRDMASCMTCEFRKEYRAEVMSEIRLADGIGLDISDCFEPMADSEDKELKGFVDNERERMGTSPYMCLYHFTSDEAKREVVNKIADLYNEYDKSLMHKTHRVNTTDFAIEGEGSARTRVSTISGLHEEEVLLLSKLIERRSREADIIELGKQDPDLEAFYKDRKIPEHVVGDYSIDPMGKDAKGNPVYSLTVSENDIDAAAGMLMEAKLTFITPYETPYLEMFQYEREEMEKINTALDKNQEFTIVDVNNASHILRVYKDGYSEISRDEDGKVIKNDYEVTDPVELKHAVKDVMNTMVHPFHMDRKDIKPKDIVVNEEYQERVSAFAALDVKTDDAFQYSPKNFMKQFKVEITEQGGVKIDAPEHVQPPVIAVEDIELNRKNDKIRKHVAMGLDLSEAKEVGEDLDPIEWKKFSSDYHPTEEERAEEEKERGFAREDLDKFLDKANAAFVGIQIASRFPERAKEEEHSLGSMLQGREDLGEGFAAPDIERDSVTRD